MCYVRNIKISWAGSCTIKMPGLGWSYFLLYSSHSSIGPSFIELCRRVVKPSAYTARNDDINLYRGYIDGRLLCVPPLKSRRMNETLDEREGGGELGGRASRKTTDKNMVVKEEEEWEAKERNDTNTHEEKEREIGGRHKDPSSSSGSKKGKKAQGY